jgi:hypothetical protein
VGRFDYDVGGRKRGVVVIEAVIIYQQRLSRLSWNDLVFENKSFSTMRRCTKVLGKKFSPME